MFVEDLVIIGKKLVLRKQHWLRVSIVHQVTGSYFYPSTFPSSIENEHLKRQSYDLCFRCSNLPNPNHNPSEIHRMFSIFEVLLLTGNGMFLRWCNHGIDLIVMKLYAGGRFMPGGGYITCRRYGHVPPI